MLSCCLFVAVALIGSEETLAPYSTEPVSLHLASRDSKAVKQCNASEQTVVYTQLEGFAALKDDDDRETKQVGQFGKFGQKCIPLLETVMFLDQYWPAYCWLLPAGRPDKIRQACQEDSQEHEVGFSGDCAPVRPCHADQSQQCTLLCKDNHCTSGK